MLVRVAALAGAALALAAAVVVWILKDSQNEQTRRQEERRARRLAAVRRSVPRGARGAFDISAVRRYGAISSQPRLVANLSARAGPYIVSIRQVTAEDNTRNIWDAFDPVSALARPLGVTEVLLQVDPVQPELPIPRLRFADAPGRDEQGNLLHREVRPELVAPLTLPTGWGFRVRLTSIAERSRFIEVLEGVLSAPTDGDEWPFSIHKIPLPTCPRLFGDISILTPTNSLAFLRTREPLVLTGDRVVEVENSSTTAQPVTTLPYLRLILPVGTTTGIQAVLPTPSYALSVRAEQASTGHIRVTGQWRGKAWSVQVWEYEPFVVVLPNPGSQAPTCLRVSLYPTNETIFLPAAKSVFPPERATRAGSLAFFIRVNERPLGPALLPVSLERWEEGAWSSPRTVSMPVQPTGLAVLGGLAEGRYRVRLDTSRLNVLSSFPVGEYLERRYGASQGTWHNVLQEVSVVAGQRSYAKTVTFTPARATTVTQLPPFSGRR